MRSVQSLSLIATWLIDDVLVNNIRHCMQKQVTLHCNLLMYCFAQHFKFYFSLTYGFFYFCCNEVSQFIYFLSQRLLGKKANVNVNYYVPLAKIIFLFCSCCVKYYAQLENKDENCINSLRSGDKTHTRNTIFIFLPLLRNILKSY